ncbi:unnamed protein product [Chironomus riparius]|uniref:MYND-type domain-containing protein n=1 Tax=Chironomus riparius TaxID=315576 RepID=A0A9N9S8L6_9DIPT|nr:unnamed protein product [Chironomus riparius]
MSKRAEPLTKGSLILQEKPFAYIVKSKFIKERCDFCLSTGKLLKCGGCHFTHYCGVLCQRDAWAEHKYECLCMKKILPRSIPDAARIMAKIIWKLQYGGYLQKFYYSRNGFRKFNDLMAHLEDIKWDEKRMEHVQSLYAVLKEYLAPEHLPNQTEFLGIYGRLCINSFNILDDDLNSIGTGIYLAASILDHSCNPNAVATFEGPQLSIRLIEDIPELKWDQIRISYVELLDLPETRKEELRRSYYFDCDCDRCKDEKQRAKMVAMACPKEGCDGYIDVMDEKCKECQTEIKEEHRSAFDDVLDMTKVMLQEMQETRYIDICRNLIKKQTGVLHDKNIWHLKTLDLAFESAIDFEAWEEAVGYGKKFVQGLSFYTSPLNPLVGIDHLKLGKIYPHLNEFQTAIHHIREAGDVLKFTHGDQSRVMRDFVRPLLRETQIMLEESQRIKMPPPSEEEEEEAAEA